MTRPSATVALVLLAGALVVPGAGAQEPPGAPLEEARPPSEPEPDRSGRPSGAGLAAPGEPGMESGSSGAADGSAPAAPAPPNGDERGSPPPSDRP